MTFIAELKRRNVIRVGLAYLVLSWLLEIAEQTRQRAQAERAKVSGANPPPSP